jgi:hypothetical protein
MPDDKAADSLPQLELDAFIGSLVVRRRANVFTALIVLGHLAGSDPGVE